MPKLYSGDSNTPKGSPYNGDFKKYYDTKLKRNYWVLGYFGGGAVAIMESFKVAVDYARATGVPIESVKMDEILSSRRHKGFKFVYSTLEQTREKGKNVTEDENVYAWLRD